MSTYNRQVGRPACLNVIGIRHLVSSLGLYLLIKAKCVDCMTQIQTNCNICNFVNQLVECYCYVEALIILCIDFNRMHIDVIEFISSPSFHMASNCFVNPQGETDTYEETRLNMTVIKAIVLRFDNSNRNRMVRTVVYI